VNFNHCQPSQETCPNFSISPRREGKTSTSPGAGQRMEDARPPAAPSCQSRWLLSARREKRGWVLRMLFSCRRQTDVRRGQELSSSRPSEETL